VHGEGGGMMMAPAVLPILPDFGGHALPIVFLVVCLVLKRM